MDKEEPIWKQRRVEANFRLQHRHSKQSLLFLLLLLLFLLLLFLEIELCKKFLCGPPFAKIPQMTDFSGLGNRRLRCVRSTVSSAKPLSLRCLIRTLIPSTLSVTSRSPLSRNGNLNVALNTGFRSLNCSKNFGDTNADNSTNSGRSYFSIAPS